MFGSRGAPTVVGPSAVLKDAPHPNAARLFQSFLFSQEAQQLIIDIGALRSAHDLTHEKPGRRPFTEIKRMKDDPAAIESQADEIKKRYTQYFRT